MIGMSTANKHLISAAIENMKQKAELRCIIANEKDFCNVVSFCKRENITYRAEYEYISKEGFDERRYSTFL